MDKEFVEKLDAIREGSKEDDTHEQSDFSLSYSDKEDGLVLVETSQGSFEHRVKPLQELYAPGHTRNAGINTDDPRDLQLLFTIEGAIKREYEKDHSLVDSSVMLALDKMAVKPESLSNDAIIKAIQNNLRLLLSTHDYSRDEVKQAVRKILRSVKRHKDSGGIRGYLDFILEHVP